MGRKEENYSGEAGAKSKRRRTGESQTHLRNFFRKGGKVHGIEGGSKGGGAESKGTQLHGLRETEFGSGRGCCRGKSRGRELGEKKKPSRLREKGR